MATTVFDLQAILGIDTSAYEKGLKLAGAAIGAATTAVVGFGATSVKTGAEFDKSMSQVAATMGTTVDQIDDLRNFAQEMGRTTAFSATQSADALNYMALAGYDAETSMAMLPNVLNLAAAGSIDLARASDMITDTQTAFGISLERTSLLVDEMAKAASTGNTSVEQLGDAFLTVGGLAAELNGGMVTLDDGTEVAVDGIQELEIALTAMANAGIKGSEAGTHMRNMLLKLSSPTSDGAVALEAMGVAVFDAEGNMRSLSDVFGDLSDKLGEMTQEQKIQTISDLFNTRDLASAEALLNAVGEDWDNIGESILNAVSFDGVGALQNSGIDWSNYLSEKWLKNAETMGDAWGDLSNQIRYNLEDQKLSVEETADFIASEYGLSMEDASTAVLAVQDAIDNTTHAAQQMADTQLDNLAGDITLFKSALEGAQIAVSDALTPALRDFVKFGTDGLSRLTDAFQTGGLDGAMQAFGEILSEGLNMIIEKMPQFINAGMQLLGALGQGILDNLPVIIDSSIQIIQQLITGFVEAMPMLIEGALQILLGLANGIAEMLPTLIPTIVEVIVTIVNTLLDNIDLLIDASIALIIGLAEGLINALPKLIERIPEIVVKIVEALIRNVPKLNEAAKQIIFGLANGIISFIGKLGEVALDLMVALAEGIVNLRDKIFDSAVNVMDTFKDGILGFVDKAKTWGKDLIDNFVNGIKDKINSVKETVGNVAQTVKDILGFSEPKDGPLSNFHTYAPDMMNLFAQGIRDNEKMLQDTVSNAFDLQDQIAEANVNATAVPALAGGGYVDENMVNVITEALRNIMVQVNIGDQPFDDMVSTSIQRNAYRSGGR